MRSCDPSSENASSAYPGSRNDPAPAPSGAAPPPGAVLGTSGAHSTARSGWRLHPGGAAVILNVEQHGPVVWLRLDRPEKLNALDRATHDALRRELLRAEGDAGTRSVVITGTGRAFCAGGDITEIRRAAGDPELSGPGVTFRTATTMQLIEWMGTPVITAVNGLAYGAGLALVLAADLCVASEAAVFGIPEARHGFFDPYMPARLAPRIGLERARLMTYTGRDIPAAEAQAWGLVSSVVPPGDLEKAAQSLAEELAAMSPSALRKYKHLFRRTLPEYDLGAYLEGSLSPDVAAGIDAFTDEGES